MTPNRRRAMIVSTGISELDQEIRARGKPPGIAKNVADIGEDVSVVTISRKTRGLELLGRRPSITRLIGRALDDSTLELVGGAVSVEELSLNGSTMTHLRPLSSLRRLRSLEISVASRLASIEGVERLSSLEYFSIWRCVRLRSVAPLRQLTRLKLIFLAGNMYAPMRLDSLRPLAELAELRVLKLASVRIRDRDLSPLHGLGALEWLELPDYFPRRSFEALALALPSVRGRWKERLVEPQASRRKGR